MAANYFKYHNAVGTLNPLTGIVKYFTSGDIASAMWDNEGAAMYGANRGGGQLDGGMGGGATVTVVVDYILTRLQPVSYLLIGLLKSRFRLPLLIGVIASSMLAATGGYFGRTTVLMNFGIVGLYYNDHVRRFSKKSIFLTFILALFIFLVLHLARLGKIEDVTFLMSSETSEQFHQAAADTFEPVAYALLYYETIGSNRLEDNVKHVAAYAGALIPRVFWSGKPFYAFEPDITMELSGADISATNVVRTYTIMGEGLIIGGLPGVLLIAFLFALTISRTCHFLERYDEFCIFRYYVIVLSAYFFRLSLITYFNGIIVLGVIPVLVSYYLLRPLMKNRPEVGGFNQARMASAPQPVDRAM